MANRLIIRNNQNNTIVYNQKIVTFRFQHVLPPNVPNLNNGSYYSAQLYTYDSQDTQSVSSNIIQFYCYTQPTLSIVNMPVGNIITNSTYEFSFLYNQIQKELLNSYIVNLYDTTGQIISTSGTQYIGSSAQPPTTFVYTFKGFDDKAAYYIESVGITVNNTVVTTGKVSFTVRYVAPTAFALLQLSNECEKGYIDINSNIQIIEGESNPSPPIYINNQKINLTAPNSWVRWSTGYNISNDFLMRIWAERLTVNSEINIDIANNNSANTPNKISLWYFKGYDFGSTLLQHYMVAKVYNSNKDVPYVIFSNFINIPNSTDTIFIYFRRVNDIYELKIENKGVMT